MVEQITESRKPTETSSGLKVNHGKVSCRNAIKMTTNEVLKLQHYLQVIPYSAECTTYSVNYMGAP